MSGTVKHKRKAHPGRCVCIWGRVERETWMRIFQHGRCPEHGTGGVWKVTPEGMAWLGRTGRVAARPDLT